MKFILALLFIPCSLVGQGINNLWMMGYAGGLGGIDINFNSGNPIISHVAREMNFLTTSVSICDNSGNLLFCSNGVYVVNALGDTMLNGSNLSPCNYTYTTGWNGMFIPQASIIIPKPGTLTSYYLFHGSVEDEISPSALKFYYSEIDITLDSGRGAVISKNNVLLNDTLVPGRMTAVKHGNGRDWWIIIHQGKSERYYIFLVNPSGIHLSDQVIGSYRDFRHGQVCFSQDGSKFAYYDVVNDLDIMDFDRCTGFFSNPIHVSINDSADGGGVAFSPSGRFLYVSSTKYAYQFDLQSANVPGSQLTVAVWDTFYSPSPPAATTFYQAQLAPDGKIYLSCTNGTLDIHVINYPDSLGMTCNFCQHCIHLPAYNGATMPNHPNYFLGADLGSICDSLTNDVPNIYLLVQMFNLFPNPARNSLYITQSKAEQIQAVSFFNSLGQLQTVGYNSINNGEYVEANVSDLISGIYYVEILTAKQKLVKKFIKE